MKASLAYGLSILNLFIWGSWPYIRSLANKVDGPVFAPWYFLGNWSTTIILGVIMDPNMFLRDLNLITNSSKVICSLFAGFIIAHSDFLCACACNYVPYAIAFPIYAGIMMVQGISLTYFVMNGVGSNPLYLFPGIVLGLFAILCLAMADVYKVEEGVIDVDERKEGGGAVANNGCDSESAVSNPIREESEIFTRDTSSADHNDTDADITTTSIDAVSERGGIIPGIYQNMQRLSKWVYIMILCGIFGAFWSPLSNFSRSGPDGVLNPFTALFLFQTGQLMSVPFILSLHAQFIDDRRPLSPFSYFSAAWVIDSRDKIYCLMSGVFVGAGYFLYFVTSDSISPTVALGIASCEPLMTIVIAVLTNPTLRSASYKHKLFMTLSFLFFVIAIVFMTLSSYYSSK